LTIDGLGCLLLTVVHTTIDARWIPSSLTSESALYTSFNPASTLLATERITWYVVVPAVLAFSIFPRTLVVTQNADLETLLLC
jgi:hypothetical protein